MKVSFHPAQVGTPNKDKEGGSRFQILENPKKIYSLLKFPVKTKQDFVSFFLLFRFSEFFIQLRPK